MEKNKNKSCLQICFEEILKYWNLNSDFLIFQIFGIDYCNRLNSDAIYKKFRPGQIGHFTDFCSNIYGLEFYRYYNALEFVKNIKRGIRCNYKIMAGFDNFYLPWGNTFQKVHLIHFFNILDIDEKGNILCYDGYNEKYSEKLDVDNFIKGYKSGYYITKTKKSTENIDKLFEFISKKIKNDENVKAYEMLINELSNIKSYEELFESSDTNSCEVIIVTKMIINYEKMKLKILQENMCNREIYECVYQIAQRWDNILNLLLYLRYSRKIKEKVIDTITRKIKEICDYQVYEWKIIKNTQVINAGNTMA